MHNMLTASKRQGALTYLKFGSCLTYYLVLTRAVTRLNKREELAACHKGIKNTLVLILALNRRSRIC